MVLRFGGGGCADSLAFNQMPASHFVNNSLPTDGQQWKICGLSLAMAIGDLERFHRIPSIFELYIGYELNQPS